MMAFVSPVGPLPDSPRRRSSARAPLTVALVNNMPDTALTATERQFRHAIGQYRGRDVRLQIYYFPEVPRSESALAYCRAHYAPLDTLLGTDVDALVVTGCEPRMASLADEPFWKNFARLADWAKRHTLSALWSCLAAHAAVLHLDGIERCRLPRKLSGVYACARAADHPLTAGIAEPVWVPHSRYNGLREGDLAQRGYAILTGSDTVGADSFIKRFPSLFVFLQGHPEYEGRSLGREFRRDVGRFLAGERDRMPDLPDHYFDEATHRALEKFAAEATRTRDPALFERLPDLGAPARQGDWQAAAARLYRNWLGIVADAAERTATVNADLLAAERPS